MIAELEEGLCLMGVVPGHAWPERMNSHLLTSTVELMEWKVGWNEIKHRQIS